MILLNTRARFIYVNAADNKILNAEARRLYPVKDRSGTGEACVPAVEAEEQGRSLGYGS